jgi:hypothetical protein
MFIRIVVFCLLSLPVAVTADSFVGNFAGQLGGHELGLSINRAQDGRYLGSMLTYGEALPLSAELRDGMLVGHVNDRGNVIGFVAAAREGTILFKFDAGETIAFRSTKPTSSTSSPSSVAQRSVLINRIRLAPDVLQALEATHQTRIEDGRYWYDAACGAWGVEGGPTAGFILAGLDLPGPMPADISGGGTGIFINGREIHPLDQAGLQQLFGVTYRGHYWLDANGNLGPVGGPAIANIVSAIQQAQAAQSQSSGGSVSHGYGSAYGARGTVGGGMYSGRTASGKSVFWYPGM